MIKSEFGKNLRIDISGGSHENEIIVKIWGLPANVKISTKAIQKVLNERHSRFDGISTTRIESDIPLIWDSHTNDFLEMVDGYIYTYDNQPIVAKFKNTNFNSKEYNLNFPRPGHCDLPAKIKYGNEINLNGGGPFSGRMTVALCFAGAIAIEILKLKGIEIQGQISSVGKEINSSISLENPTSSPISDLMISEMKNAKNRGNSIGGVLEIFATGLPLGLGGPLFENLESEIASCIFSIPAVKGIEFGIGFDGSAMCGSEYNDPIIKIEPNEKIGYKMVTSKNNNGGILGGMSTGMPLIVRVAIKPTPTISLPQQTIDFKSGKQIEHTFAGRHDACILPRALPCVKSALALCLLDKLMDFDIHNKKSEILPANSKGHAVSANLPDWLSPSSSSYAFMDLSSLRSQILAKDQEIQELLEERLVLSKLIGKLKKEKNLGIIDKDREITVLSHLDDKWHDIFKNIMSVSKKAQQFGLEYGLFGLVGTNLSHSYSKKIHESFRKYKYHLIEVAKNDFYDFITNTNFTGLNLTFPYKEIVMDYLNPFPIAKNIGSANTVFFDSCGNLVGTNTDYDGFRHLVDMHNVNLKGKKILILGNGGASKAVQFAVLAYSPENITVATRQNVNKLKGLKEIKYINYEDLSDEYQVIINTTTLGNSPNVNQAPIDLHNFNRCETAIDIIYNPFMTKFLSDGKILGKKVVNGLTMLVGQAVSASNYFLASAQGIVNTNNGKIRPFVTDSTIKESVSNILKATLDIVFVGMSGAGKTTIGRELANFLDIPFIDIDEEVEKKSQKTIQELFADDEEDTFRKIEENTVKEIFSNTNIQTIGSPRVIATGGGTIFSQKNMEVITKNSLIIYLDRDLNLIRTKENPIYHKNEKEQLYSVRNPIYQGIAHIHIEHKNSIKTTLNKILREVKSYYEKNYFN